METKNIYKFFSRRASNPLDAFLGEVSIIIAPKDDLRLLKSFNFIIGFSGTFKSFNRF